MCRLLAFDCSARIDMPIRTIYNLKSIIHYGSSRMDPLQRRHRPAPPARRPVQADHAGAAAGAFAMRPTGCPGFAIVLDGAMLARARRRRPGSARARRLRAAAVDAGLLAVQPSGCRPASSSSRRTTAVRHGDPDGEPDCRMLGGAFRIEPVNAPLLLRAAAAHDPRPRGRRRHRTSRPHHPISSWKNASPTVPAAT